MASDNAAMTPEQAIAALQEVRVHRERLTARATMLIWMVWGLVLGVMGFASQAAFLASYHAGWVDAVMVLVAGGVGATVTNGIWRAHALERDPTHRAWVPWAAGVGGLMLLGIVIWLTNVVARAQGTTWGGEPGFMMAPVLLIGAVGAAIITALTRRVATWPGALAAAVLAVGFAVTRFGAFERTDALDLVGNLALNLANMLVFVAVGAWIGRRG